MGSNLLTPLAEYSRQTLQVGTPPVYIFTADGSKPSQDIIQLSLLARIADALEGQQQLATTTVQIQPTHANEFRDLVADLVADRPGRVEIVGWHLLDEHTLKVTLAYEYGESLFFIGRYWQAMRGEALGGEGDQCHA